MVVMTGTRLCMQGFRCNNRIWKKVRTEGLEKGNEGVDRTLDDFKVTILNERENVGIN